MPDQTPADPIPAEVYDIAARAYLTAAIEDRALGGLLADNPAWRAAIDAVWPLAVVAVRRQASAAIVEALCGQALADHLGDVRDAERHLWDALGVGKTTRVRDHKSAWRNTRDTLQAAGIPLPAYLEDGDDDEY